MSLYTLTYVKFTSQGNSLGFGWIVPQLWPTNAPVCWEAMKKIDDAVLRDWKEATRIANKKGTSG